MYKMSKRINYLEGFQLSYISSSLLDITVRTEMFMTNNTDETDIMMQQVLQTVTA